MSDLRRYAARVVVRRVVYLVLALLLAGLGIGGARAQDSHPTEQEAYQHCLSKQVEPYPDAYYAQYHNPTGCKKFPEDGNQWIGTSTHVSAGGVYKWDRHGYTTACPDGIDIATGNCRVPCSANAPPLTGGYIKVPTPDAFDTCSGSCSYIDNDDTTSCAKIDGMFYCSVKDWIPEGLSCTVDPSSDGITPPADTDGDSVSDGKDGAPSNPGSTGSNDGPKDTNGDGTPDCGGPSLPVCPDTTDATKHSSSGGGDCSSAPVSSGDPILAQIAFQTWATRCALTGKFNTGGGTVIGGTGTDMTATNAKLDGIKSGVDGIGDFLKGARTGTDPDTTAVDAAQSGSVMTEREIGSGLFDQTGFGYSRSCPAPITVQVFSQTITFDTSILCNWLTVGGWFVLLITAWRCIQAVAAA